MTVLSFGRSCDGSVRRPAIHMSIIFAFLLIETGSHALLFPDMAVMANPLQRSGPHFKYRIYALQQEPYLSANGTGYLPELMVGLAKAYNRLRKGVITFNTEVLPVESWKDLLNKAEYQHEKLAFGLICPSVLRTDAMYKEMHSSVSVVPTSIKLITHISTRQSHPYMAVSGHALHLSKGSSFVMVRGSPEDRLLVVRPKFRSSYREVDSIEDGLEHISQHPESYLVTDSSIADNIVNDKSAGGKLTSLCTSKKILNSNHLFYGFFGRNANLLKFINDLLRTMTEDGTLSELNAKHFSGLKQCV